ncbi:MAG: hypothetical protein AAGE59_38360, partial [Cyanobacteria bacterium P01_F01_bin.86]
MSFASHRDVPLASVFRSLTEPMTSWKITCRSRHHLAAEVDIIRVPRLASFAAEASIILVPKQTSFCNWYEEVVPHTLSFALAPDIPRWATNDFYALCNDFDIDEEPLDDIARALSKDISKNYVGKLLVGAVVAGKVRESS